MSLLLTIYNCQIMKQTVESFIVRTARDMRLRGQFSVARTCTSALKGLSAVAGNRILTFVDLTPALLKNYEHYLLGHERSRNTVSLYMRTLHNICNRARRKGIACMPGDLFEGVFTGMDPVRHRAVAPEVIRRIGGMELEGRNARLAFARDMFILSFYLQGIPFIDLAYLRKCDLKGETITYRRRKTGKPACLMVEPCALEIIDRYAPLAGKTIYLLPIIRTQGNLEDERRLYESALRLYNKHLNRIGILLGLDMPLTSYVARHSWATIAHDIGVDIADISTALCHSSEKMTHNYLQSFTTDRQVSVNRRVLRAVLGNETGNIKKGKYKKGKIPRDVFYSGSL